MVRIESEGRRHYLVGDTYAVRDRIRALGAHWDAGRKAWWTGKRDQAEALVAQLNAAPAPAASEARPEPQAPGMSAIVAGRATYKGRTYYIAGRRERGRTAYDDTVEAIRSRDGSRVLLYFRDGSRQFWAPTAEVQVLRTYERPQTIQGLRDYAERAQQGGGERLEDGYYYGPGGEVLARGCGECSRLGRMCRSCEHDYE